MGEEGRGAVMCIRRCLAAWHRAGGCGRGGRRHREGPRAASEPGRCRRRRGRCGAAWRPALDGRGAVAAADG